MNPVRTFASLIRLLTGLQVHDADGNVVAYSTAAAKSAIAQVCFSRIAMTVPSAQLIYTAASIVVGDPRVFLVFQPPKIYTILVQKNLKLVS